MEYQQAIKFLYEQLPMYQRVGPVAYKNNLDNTLALDEAFHHPHRNFKTIHVAGTNGKGSVSHMLASVLQSAGYKVGLYTSPHLKDFRERMKVNGNMISEEAVSNFVERYIELNKQLKLEPSFFELTVLMAFDYFAAEKIDIAVVEVGLGGRLDSTNIISPEISIITNISFDHMNLLGDTLEKIAIEKAGIIKSEIPVVIGEHHPQTFSVFAEKALYENAPLLFADQEYHLSVSENGTINVGNQRFILYQNIAPDLKGDYQQKNILTVVAAIEILKKKDWKISTEAVLYGFSKVVEQTGLMGRWQQLGKNPKIICDTGHNEGGISWIVEQLKNEKYDNLHIVFGMVNDKDIENALKLLPVNATYYFTKASIERALDEKQLRKQAFEHGLNGECYPTVEQALAAAKKNALPSDFIYIGGSTFVVAEVI